MADCRKVTGSDATGHGARASNYKKMKRNKKMKLNNVIEIDAFQKAVDQAEKAVYLKSVEGDCYNLKSTLSRYVAIGELISQHGDELELFCDSKSDEALFLKFFYNYPDTL